jgi:sugar phosphate isomerase/epimerase
MKSRREFLGAATAAAVWGAGARPARAAQLKSIGVQLYTVRSVLPQKPEETLKAIHDAGYQEIEATFAGFDKIWPAVQASGLKPVSMHMDGKMVMQGGDPLDKAIDQLKGYGFKYAVHPYVQPSDRGGPEVMKKLAEVLNRLGEKARAGGMQCAYHNHAFEFETVNGSTLFDVLAENTDKKLVGFELDLFWLTVAGNDPADFILKHKGRVPLVHLKDMAAGTEKRFNESVPRTAFKEVGSGTIDWKKALKAAASVGVQHYFVEQDQTPGDPLESLKKSHEYLASLKY